MNSWQAFRQAKYLLQERNWTGSSTVVFNPLSIYITAAPREESIEKLILPAVFLRPGAATSDDEYPDLIEQEMVVTLAVGHAGDAFGELPVIGGHRAGQTQSEGRGLLEVEEELFAALELLNTDDGIVIQLMAKSAVTPEYVSGQYILFRDYLFRLNVTADRFYHPVMNLQEA